MHDAIHLRICEQDDSYPARSTDACIAPGSRQATQLEQEAGDGEGKK